MKVAIVTDWLVVYGGAERVLEQMINCFPNADLFSLVEALPASERGFLQGKPVKTSFINKLPFAAKKHRAYLPLMPLAIEQFDLSSYDIVLSSSYAVAKGVITGPDQLHICYCHSPIRYAWDLQHQYLAESKLIGGVKGWLARWVLHKIRVWDARTAFGVDHFLANSHFIARRIHKVYRRKSTVIYPPVDVEKFACIEDKDDFYVTASRMVPYKRMGLIVEAFNKMPDKKLAVIGDGPEFAKIKAMAGPNITLLGYQSTTVLRDYVQRAKAFVFAAEEDFGIVPVEAQACGTPVIAYGKGGALETVCGLNHVKPTGVLFHEQTVEALSAAVQEFEQETARITAENCRSNALRFSIDSFCSRYTKFVTDAMEESRRVVPLTYQEDILSVDF